MKFKRKINKNGLIIILKNNLILYIGNKNTSYFFWVNSNKKFKRCKTIYNWGAINSSIDNCGAIYEPTAIDLYLIKLFPFINYQGMILKEDCIQNSFIREIMENEINY
jgi:hypothetical protein